ncbi:MAG: DUF1206 domain-containing protein, partial [Ilumatobacteraceae bacterium]
KLGRAGWFAKGLVYVIAGYLALSVALKASGWSDSASTGTQEASPTGAIKSVAGSGPGTALLWLLAIGLLLYAAWRVVSALLPGGTDGEAMVHRIGYLISAVVYIALAISAITLARSAAKQPNGNQKVTDISASIMEHSAGRWLIGLAGAIMVGAGLYRIWKGIKVDVADELDLGRMSAQRRTLLQRLGAVGEIGRGIGIGLVGFFLARAAFEYKPDEATGLDGALRRLATESWGVVVVAIVGIGFVAYGIFCLVTFHRRRLQAP